MISSKATKQNMPMPIINASVNATRIPFHKVLFSDMFVFTIDFARATSCSDFAIKAESSFASSTHASR